MRISLTRALLVLLATGALTLSACQNEAEAPATEAEVEDVLSGEGTTDDVMVVDDSLAPVDGLVDSLGAVGDSAGAGQ